MRPGQLSVGRAQVFRCSAALALALGERRCGRKGEREHGAVMRVVQGRHRESGFAVCPGPLSQQRVIS